MPKRIQRKRSKGWRMPQGAVYVGRGSRWGNPFKIGVDGTAEECIKKYIDSLIPYKNHNCGLEDFLVSEVAIDEIKDDLQGKDLACWCAPDQPCHADWLLKMANPS